MLGQEAGQNSPYLAVELSAFVDQERTRLTQEAAQGKDIGTLESWAYIQFAATPLPQENPVPPTTYAMVEYVVGLRATRKFAAQFQNERFFQAGDLEASLLVSPPARKSLKELVKKALPVRVYGVFVAHRESTGEVRWTVLVEGVAELTESY